METKKQKNYLLRFYVVMVVVILFASILNKTLPMLVAVFVLLIGTIIGFMRLKKGAKTAYSAFVGILLFVMLLPIDVQFRFGNQSNIKLVPVVFDKPTRHITELQNNGLEENQDFIVYPWNAFDNPKKAVVITIGINNQNPYEE